MRKNDSVMREFDELGVPDGTEPDGQGGHTASYERLINTLTKEQESVIKAFLSHSLAEARREERERILTMAHNIRSELKEPGYISLTRLEDLLTGDNPERKV